MDVVCYNGAQFLPDRLDLSPDRMFSVNYIYQHIHTFQHQALHLKSHLELMNHALERMCGCSFLLPEESLQGEIEKLLVVNRYPEGSNQVTLRLFPHGLQHASDGGEPSYLLEVTAQLLYPHYVLWHHRPLLDVFACEHAWPGCPTSVSLLTAACGREAAVHSGAQLAVIENRDGVLTHIDDEPLFLIFGREVVTTPLERGATDSVLRRLVSEACRKERIQWTEYPLSRDMLIRCDEAFTVTTQGVVALLGVRDYRYFNLTASKISGRLNDVTLL